MLYPVQKETIGKTKNFVLKILLHLPFRRLTGMASIREDKRRHGQCSGCALNLIRGEFSIGKEPAALRGILEIIVCMAGIMHYVVMAKAFSDVLHLDLS